jgi:hypothetical protein
MVESKIDEIIMITYKHNHYHYNMNHSLCFDILDDLSDDLDLLEYFRFIFINDFTYELSYKTIKFAEYFYTCHSHDVLVYGNLIPCDSCHYIDEYQVCEEGDLRVVKWFNEKRGKQFKGSSMFWRACIEGNLDIARWLYERDKRIVVASPHPNTIQEICDNGHLDVMRWLYEKIEEISISG